MASERIVATYRLETALPLEDAAQAIAGEQSTGTFVAVPGETEELRAAHGARVDSVEPLDEVRAPSLPGAMTPPAGGSFRRGQVRISFPVANIGSNLPTLMSTVAGNLFELRQVSGMRLMDLSIPPSITEAHPGPRYGVDGTRRLSGVQEGPLVGTIIKPSVGLSPRQTAQLVSQLATAGIDFIKDDELMADPPHNPFEDRVRAVMDVIDRAADRNGKRLMYAFNISGDLDTMLRHQDLVAERGGTCVMVSLNSVGLVAVEHLRKHSDLPIHGHRNGWGMLTRHPMLGMEFKAYQTFWRLAGVDQLHVNGLQNKFWEPDASVAKSIRACLDPSPTPVPLMPVVSSGQWGGQAEETLQQGGSADLIYLAGGGILGHPGGAEAGVRAIRLAWQAAMDGIPFADQVARHGELRQSVERFARGEKRRVLDHGAADEAP